MKKPISSFWADKSQPKGLYSWCKSCAYNSKRKQYDKDYARLKKYGISKEQYESLLKKQNYCCAICKQGSNSRDLAVDHIHGTNKIRGLLCLNCNTGLGRFMDSPYILLDAVKYLQETQREDPF